jgi:hypothetical protein
MEARRKDGFGGKSACQEAGNILLFFPFRFFLSSRDDSSKLLTSVGTIDKLTSREQSPTQPQGGK